MINLKEIAPYANKLFHLSFSKLMQIAGAYGTAVLQELTGLPYDDDKGGTVMTQVELTKRLDACDGGCPLKTSANWCNPSATRPHKTEKNSDGSPLMVSGCACALWAKQRKIEEHCPAGEW